MTSLSNTPAVPAIKSSPDPQPISWDSVVREEHTALKQSAGATQGEERAGSPSQAAALGARRFV